jgi:hypothetical protein
VAQAAPPPVLHTARLVLRPPRLADFEYFAAFYASDRSRWEPLSQSSTRHGKPVRALTLEVGVAGFSPSKGSAETSVWPHWKPFPISGIS